MPRIQRRAESLEDLDGFFERWQAGLGTAVIDPPAHATDTLLPAETPARVREDEARHTIAVRADGTVPVGDGCAGNVADTALADLWSAVQEHRPGL